MPRMKFDETRNDGLEAENDKLRELLAEREEQAAALADELMQLKGRSDPRAAPPAVFLIILIVVLAGRMALYAFVEHMGAAARVEGLISDAVFGVAAIFLLSEWVKAEWFANGLLVIAKGTLIAVALAIAVPAFVENPLPTALMVGAVLVLSASYVIDQGMAYVVKVLGGRR
jgi:hypothetical protein